MTSCHFCPHDYPVPLFQARRGLLHEGMHELVTGRWLYRTIIAIISKVVPLFHLETINKAQCKAGQACYKIFVTFFYFSITVKIQLLKSFGESAYTQTVTANYNRKNN